MHIPLNLSMKVIMNKYIVLVITLCIALPACKQVPRVKPVPKIEQPEYRIKSSSSDIEAYAQPLTKVEARHFIGFTPNPKEFGNPWIVTLYNNGSDTYRFSTHSWKPHALANHMIMYRFNNLYKNHAWYVWPILIPILLVVTPVSTMACVFAAGSHLYGATALFGTITVLPFIGAEYYTYSNNQAMEFSINQLFANLLPEYGILKPLSVHSGLIFLPAEATNWQLVLERTHDDAPVIIEHIN